MTTATETTRFHISLDVGDLAASVAFYRDLLAIDPDKLHDGYARFTLDAPPVVLSLVQRGCGRAPSGPQRVSHMGFRLESGEQVDAARRRLTAAGRALREEPGARCCYALQNKFWVNDPDGNEWEFYVLLEDLQTFGNDSKGCCN